MAKLKSLLKIEGTLDGMTFYKKADGQYYVRAKGGVKKERILNDPSFARTRENNSEFAEVAKSGKQFRRALVGALTNVKDRTKTTRLSSNLFKVKNYDTTSGRGERKVSIGIQEAEAKVQLVGFDFNKNAPLDTVLLQNYVINTTSKEISLGDFIPNIMLANPKGATHVKISAYHANYDFNSFESELVASNVETLAIDSTSSNITFSFTTPASGTGVELFLLKIEFLQELNGDLYQLNNGTFNALKLVSMV
tara:strand:+ start:2700 stop:3452 length:753 start_codon:yes stop_codon:yes gene_type:complete